MHIAGIVTRNKLARTLGMLYKANINANMTETLGPPKAEDDLLALPQQPGSFSTYGMKQPTPQRRSNHDHGLSIKHPHGGASYERGYRNFAKLRNFAEPRGRARRAKAYT